MSGDSGGQSIICVFLLGVDNLSDMFVDISRPVFYGGLAALLAAAVVIARVDYNKNAEKKASQVH
ncbi:hypothetical protein OSL26_25975 [Escherichia coli]|nr:hypothetical protein [Escherichia coli]